MITVIDSHGKTPGPSIIANNPLIAGTAKEARDIIKVHGGAHDL